MPTPRHLLTALNRVPTQACIIHEVGHATVAFRQGGHGSIVFYSNAYPGWSAFATNNKQGVSPRELIIRSLAGIATQARLYPGSLSEWLGLRLRDGGLFASDYCLRKGSRAEQEMTANQAGDDWKDIKSYAKGFSWALPPRLQELRAAEAELAEIWASAWFLPVVQAMSADINVWLDENDDDLLDYVSYPTNRIGAIFAQVPGALLP